MAGASLLLPFLPLLPLQILLINFLTDLPGTTIATDAVEHVAGGVLGVRYRAKFQRCSHVALP